MFLDKIVDKKREEVAQLKQGFSQEHFESIIATLPPARSFHQALTKDRNRQMGLIAEVKKASPSKGLIRENFEPADIAKAYQAAGADCLSVLTDAPFFQGSKAYLTHVRQTTNLPILRKDFIIDPLQIYEARAIGADAVLLIAAILDKDQLAEYLQIARKLGMDALVEVHDEEELQNALDIEAELIGINNRNLKTFETSLSVTERLIKHIPDGKTVVSESGISEPKQIEELLEMRVSAVLIGEHFMRQDDIEQAVHHLMGNRREQR